MNPHDELTRAMGLIGVLACVWLTPRWPKRATPLLVVLTLLFMGLVLCPQVLRHGGSQ